MMAAAAPTTARSSAERPEGVRTGASTEDVVMPESAVDGEETFRITRAEKIRTAAVVPKRLAGRGRASVRHAVLGPHPQAWHETAR